MKEMKVSHPPAYPAAVVNTTKDESRNLDKSANTPSLRFMLKDENEVTRDGTSEEECEGDEEVEEEEEEEEVEEDEVLICKNDEVEERKEFL